MIKYDDITCGKWIQNDKCNFTMILMIERKSPKAISFVQFIFWLKILMKFFVECLPKFMFAK